MEQTTKQQPINSPFTKKSTSEQVMKSVDLAGKTAIVTGGYSGIGLKVTEYLIKAGAHVIVPAKSLAKAKAAVKKFPTVEIGELDLMNPESIDHFADTFLQKKRPLDLLIEVAGIMFAPLKRDQRGIESQFSTNYLGHFQLTQRLYPALKAAKKARVVIASSRAQSWNGVDFADFNFEKKSYDPRVAYAQSKAADILFAVELDKRGREDGIRAYAVHPGLVPGTSLGRFVMKNAQLQKGVSFLLNNLQGTRIINIKNALTAKLHGEKEYDYFKTVNQGAASLLWATSSPLLDDQGGIFIEDSNIGVAVGETSTSKFGVRPWSIDPEQAEKLWALGEKLTQTDIQR